MLVEEKQTCFLDKSVQLSTSNIITDKLRWQNKAYRKAYQVNLVKQMLMSLEPQSREYLYVLRGGFCSSVIRQIDQKTQTNYCNTRFCSTCERIRKAKRIDAYLEPISKIDEPHFVTLTIKSVRIDQLRESIKSMTSIWRASRKYFSRKKIITSGIKTIEFNYNPKLKTFNPHFHIIINSKLNADLLTAYWLKHNEGLSTRAQDIRPILKNDKNTLFEVFAYTTKTIVEGKVYPHILAQSIHALMDIRTLQTFGKIRKNTNTEELDDLKAGTLSFKPITHQLIEWVWDNEFKDWRFDDELLSERLWSDKDIASINKFELTK
jgi:hypothetical protein